MYRPAPPPPSSRDKMKKGPYLHLSECFSGSSNGGDFSSSSSENQANESANRRSELEPASSNPPTINRLLKPSNRRAQAQSPSYRHMSWTETLPVGGFSDRTDELRKNFHGAEEDTHFYMSKTTELNSQRGLMIPAQNLVGQSIEYLDLDLPRPSCNKEERKVNKEDPGTVYKTVDFIKTEAFNNTRKNVDLFKYNNK